MASDTYEWEYKLSASRSVIRAKSISGPPGSSTYSWPQTPTFICVDTPDKQISLSAKLVPYKDARALYDEINNGFSFKVFKLNDGHYATVYVTSVSVDVVAGTSLSNVSISGFLADFPLLLQGEQ